MIKTNLKRIVSVLTIGLCMIMHTATANSDTSEALESVYQMQTSAMSAIGSYYMFSGLQGDSRYSRKMDADLKRFEESLDRLTATGNTIGSSESLAKSLVVWQEYKDLLETNRSDFIKDGYANARLVSNLADQVISLNKNLQNVYDEIIQKTKFKVSKVTADTRKMGLIIKSIVAEYISRSTSSLVQITANSINEGGMVAQAEEFNKLLEKLKKTSESDKTAYKLTDQISVKWSFIAKSVANYNENTVPFIVNTNGDRITKNLKSIGDHFSQGLQAKK